jgi:hypothetical protein
MKKNVRLVQYKSTGWFQVQRRYVFVVYFGWEDVHCSSGKDSSESWGSFFKEYKPTKPPELPYEVIS